ncbi:MAG: hypothetical protein JOS17DRAFT_391557 [Linnemannia elongata]|nr:MAG: hypothetical protein JOS17DRAFT_391557 [Linnemannia elongata]
MPLSCPLLLLLCFFLFFLSPLSGRLSNSPHSPTSTSTRIHATHTRIRESPFCPIRTKEKVLFVPLKKQSEEKNGRKTKTKTMMTHWADMLGIRKKEAVHSHHVEVMVSGSSLPLSFFFVMLLVANASFPDWVGLSWVWPLSMRVVPEDFSFCCCFWFSTQLFDSLSLDTYMSVDSHLEEETRIRQQSHEGCVKRKERQERYGQECEKERKKRWALEQDIPPVSFNKFLFWDALAGCEKSTDGDSEIQIKIVRETIGQHGIGPWSHGYHCHYPWPTYLLAADFLLLSFLVSLPYSQSFSRHSSRLPFLPLSFLLIIVFPPLFLLFFSCSPSTLFFLFIIPTFVFLFLLLLLLLLPLPFSTSSLLLVFFFL